MGPTAHGVALPADCEVRCGRRGVLAVRSEAREALESVGFGPDGGEVLGPCDLEGRRPLRGFAHGDRRFVVRSFRHGGLLRLATAARFADPRRPFRELVLSQALAEAGIGTPRVVAARAVETPPAGWRLTLVTVREEGTLDLAAALERLRAGEGGSGLRHRLAATLGEFVGRLHGLGFLHADLHPKNLLVGEGMWRGESPRLWVIDLDRSRLAPPLSETARLDNLRRLYRSIRRGEAGGGAWLGPGDFLRFLRGYEEGRGRGEPQEGRGRWRQEWRAIGRREARRGVWHRIGWFLDGLLPRGL